MYHSPPASLIGISGDVPTILWGAKVAALGGTDGEAEPVVAEPPEAGAELEWEEAAACKCCGGERFCFEYILGGALAASREPETFMEERLPLAGLNSLPPF